MRKRSFKRAINRELDKRRQSLPEDKMFLVLVNEDVEQEILEALEEEHLAFAKFNDSVVPKDTFKITVVDRDKATIGFVKDFGIVS